MQHETCIRVHVCRYNCHPKQPQTINKLRTNQRFEWRNKQARHWSDCICILSFTLCNGSTNVNLCSHCATNTPELRGESLCVCRKNRQKVVRCAVWSIATDHAQFVLETRPYFMNMHGTMSVSCCITAAECKSVPASTYTVYLVTVFPLVRICPYKYGFLDFCTDFFFKETIFIGFIH